MARKRRTDGYDQRLREALTDGPSPMSPRALAARLKGKVDRGASYGGVRAYMDAKVTTPRPELLRAMSKILGVRFEWLAYNDGEMTEQAERARRGVEQMDGEARVPRLHEDALAAMSEEWPELADAHIRTQTAALQAWAVYLAFDPGPKHRNTEQDVVDLARQVARALRAPLDALALRRIDLDADEEAGFILAMSGVLMLLRKAEARRRGGWLGFLEPNDAGRFTAEPLPEWEYPDDDDTSESGGP